MLLAFVAQGATNCGWEGTSETPRGPIKIVKPVYPPLADEQHIEGYVEFEFTVEPDGAVGDARVTTEVPDRYGFAEAALAVFPKWKFRPIKTADCKAVPTRAFFRMDFKNSP